MLRWYTPTKTFLLGKAITVTLCFVGGKWASQGADEIPQVFRKILVAHLVEVLPSLFIGHDHEAKHFFTGQSSLVV